jgi:hypothetical protein
MGSTVVEPLILIVCLSPDETGAAVATGAAAVAAAVTAGAVSADVATTVGDAAGAWVATGFVVPLSVQPANSIAQMSNAARLMVMSKWELLFAFMVFCQPFYAGY